MKLCLESKNKEQELIKAYLENNVSETLADKINNGVKIVKNGKTLINKKDLDGFLQFAKAEAQKQAEKSASYACVEDNVVYGWAVHYFEEDSIPGKLFNEDGTEYREPVKTETKPVMKQAEPKKPESPQINLFDMLATKPEPPVTTTPTSPIVEVDPSIDDIWGTDIPPVKIPSITSKPTKPQTDNYFEILKQILDHKLEAAL